MQSGSNEVTNKGHTSYLEAGAVPTCVMTVFMTYAYAYDTVERWGCQSMSVLERVAA